VFLTGTQAIVRIVLDQSRRDQAQGLRTAGFVSGYRGSPLGGVDKEMWRTKSLLVEHAIEFLPAVNEDLAATAVIRTRNKRRTYPSDNRQKQEAQGRGPHP
jgi:indolepyruvate ferredoxin oxidoreductase